MKKMRQAYSLPHHINTKPFAKRSHIPTILRTIPHTIRATASTLTIMVSIFDIFCSPKTIHTIICFIAIYIIAGLIASKTGFANQALVKSIANNAIHICEIPHPGHLRPVTVRKIQGNQNPVLRIMFVYMIPAIAITSSLTNTFASRFA